MSQAVNETTATPVAPATTPAPGSNEPPPPPKPNRNVLVGYILRSVASLLAFISAVVLGAAKESVTRSNSTMRSRGIESTQFAAYVYSITANVIVLIYSIASLMILVAKKGVLSRIAIPLSIGDLVMVVLLFSCMGAAAAVSVLSDDGQPNIGWNNICTIVAKFCGRVKESIVLSMVAGVIYFMLVVLALVGTKKRV